MDIITQKFFEPERWHYAISKGVEKGIRKDQLFQLTKPQTRLAIYELVKSGRYEIAPPHTAQIPKDNGEFRTVYVNEPVDRVFLSVANDLLFEMFADMIHPACKSYQKGIGCGKVVQQISKTIVKSYESEWLKNSAEPVVGWKADLSKYFDSVPIGFIDSTFDAIEKRTGESAVITVLRKYYHSDYYFNEDNELRLTYQSLKQGCAVASWLADVLLYHIDERISNLDGYYVRYSDDMLFAGKDFERAMQILSEELGVMSMKLNPKKVEYLSDKRWFKFLGYSIKAEKISLSKTRLKTFQKEIEQRTIANRKSTARQAVSKVNRYLYKGDGKFSWATQILPVINVKQDVDELNKFVMDCLRAVATKKRKIGGLGYIVTKENGCVERGKGRNVKANRVKTGDSIDGYLTLGCMRNALLTHRAVYDALVMSL